MKKSNAKILNFIRRNALYLILALCILAVGLSVTVMLIKQSNELSLNADTSIEEPLPDDEQGTGATNPDTDVEPVIKPVTFIMPVNNPTSIGAYSETMVWCSTMGRFESHMAIDFFAQEGESVLAVYDGVVESVESTLLEGVTVVLDHGNGLKTIYNSLADIDGVSVGQTVKQGQIIGEVSVSNRQEYKDGAHLHFEVKENGQTIDPVKYLSIDEK
ncbi:MAG: M23 family metallopeptidase [Clostridiales bacterium]|nr:M23 family metallopeptidase [Clostridiales bacterium]